MVLNTRQVLEKVSPLEARLANFCYELGAFLKRKFPDMTEWQFVDPEENPMKESFISVIVFRPFKDAKEVHLCSTGYSYGFNMVGKTGSGSPAEKVQKWLEQHADELMQDGVQHYPIEGNLEDEEFLNLLSEELAEKGYDATRTDKELVVEKFE